MLLPDCLNRLRTYILGHGNGRWTAAARAPGGGGQGAHDADPPAPLTAFLIALGWLVFPRAWLAAGGRILYLSDRAFAKMIGQWADYPALRLPAIGSA